MPDEKQDRRRARIRKAWVASWAVVAISLLCPINICLTRLALIVGAIGVWSGAAYLLSARRWAGALCLALPVPIAVFLALPGREADPEALRQEYLRQLERYEGVRFLWGGENWLGIDCSGSVRRGLINANVKLGVVTGNPRLIRRALSMWWFDSSARAMREEYRGLTSFVLSTKSLNALDHGKIAVGDLAVTAEGSHVLAYFGDETWIAADPDARAVVKIRAPAPGRRYFDVPVHIMRWAQLEVP
jgi:hypothetical protein